MCSLVHGPPGGGQGGKGGREERPEGDPELGSYLCVVGLRQSLTPFSRILVPGIAAGVVGFNDIGCSMTMMLAVAGFLYRG